MAYSQLLTCLVQGQEHVNLAAGIADSGRATYCVTVAGTATEAYTVSAPLSERLRSVSGPGLAVDINSDAASPNFRPCQCKTMEQTILT